MTHNEAALKEAVEIINAFAERDEKKKCDLCAKDEWGCNNHDAKCPFYMAYHFQLKYPDLLRIGIPKTDES